MALPLVLAVTFVGFVGVNASRVVLQLYALDLHASPTQVGMLVALYYVCPLLLSWPAGTWGDRYGPRWPLLFSALCGAGGRLIPYFVPTLTALSFAGALGGMAFACFAVVVQNMGGW